MALTSAEIWRIRAELGFNVLTVGAEPFISTTALFETVIATYLSTGASTTSTTSVAASVAAPTPVAVTLASATGFATGALVWVDVDDRMESATIQNLAGAVATIALSKAHAGTYRITVDGGEAMVREYLAQIRRVKLELGSTLGEGSLKKVDEIEFYNPANGKTLFGQLGDQLMFWRDELAALLGAPNAWRERRGSGSAIAMY